MFKLQKYLEDHTDEESADLGLEEKYFEKDLKDVVEKHGVLNGVEYQIQLDTSEGDP